MNEEQEKELKEATGIQEEFDKVEMLVALAEPVRVKVDIVNLLMETGRENMTSMISYLDENGFFESPASTKYHGAVPGGLALHSLSVYKLLTMFHKKFDFNQPRGHGQVLLPVSQDSIIIAALLHDVCKMGAYLGETPPYKWNRAQPKGHALLSLVRIARIIELRAIETMMIKFHMGVYGLLEFDSYCSEYPLRGDKTMSKEERYGKSLANAWYHNPIVKFMYFCDEIDNLAHS